MTEQEAIKNILTAHEEYSQGLLADDEFLNKIILIVVARLETPT